MREMPRLKDFLKHDPKGYRILELVIKTAVLDPVTERRKMAYEIIRSRYSDLINDIYVADNQILLAFNQGENKTVYLCDVPRYYVGSPTRCYRLGHFE